MAEPPPSSRVLLTVELAEQILSYLPFQDLVSAELVCRTWKEIIHWSPYLRQGLFLEPSPHALSMAYQSNTKLHKPWQYRSLNIKRYIETYTIAILHPYLERDPSKEGRGKIAFTLDWEKALTLNPSGRWRKMYVTQPPCRNVKIEYQVGIPTNPLYTAFRPAGRDRVSDPNGVRLGLIVDKIRELLGRFTRGEDDLQPLSMSSDSTRDLAGDAWFERLDCYVDGFISETAAFALASKAAAAAAPAGGGGVGVGVGG